MKHKIKTISKLVGTIIFFCLLIYFLEGWGIIGLIVFILGIVIMRGVKMRHFLKLMMRQVEMTIFGKPLDKDMWDKDEMKNTKVEIVWKSKSKVEWDKYIMMLVYPALILLFIGVMWNVTSVTIISFVFFSMILVVRLIHWIKNWRCKDE